MPGGAAFEPVRRSGARVPAPAQAGEQPASARAALLRPARGGLRPSRVPAPGRQRRERVGGVLSSPGRPLRPEVASSLGEALNADFSAVRVHDGPDAAASARAVGASMFTSGAHIVVGDESPGLDTPGGRRSLAHELYHVKQQAQGAVAGTPTGDGLVISEPSDPYERAAERAAEHVEDVPGSPLGQPSGTSHAAATGPLVVQRQIEETVGQLGARANEVAATLPSQLIPQLYQQASTLAFVLQEFDKFMKGLNIGYRFGGSMAAYIQGASRSPNDIDVEVSNRGKMQELAYALRQPGSGWTAAEHRNADGQVILLQAKHKNAPLIVFDMVSEADPSLKQPAEILEDMQVDVGEALPGGGLVSPAELIINYLDRIQKKPQVAQAKNDQQQILDLLIRQGARSGYKAELYWQYYIKPLLRPEHADRLKQEFSRIAQWPNLPEAISVF